MCELSDISTGGAVGGADDEGFATADGGADVGVEGDAAGVGGADAEKSTADEVDSVEDAACLATVPDLIDQY